MTDRPHMPKPNDAYEQGIVATAAKELAASHSREGIHLNNVVQGCWTAALELMMARLGPVELARCLRDTADKIACLPDPMSKPLN